MYSGIFNHIKSIKAQAYSDILNTLYNLRIYHDPAIFSALAYLEPKAYSKPFEPLTRHI